MRVVGCLVVMVVLALAESLTIGGAAASARLLVSQDGAAVGQAGAIRGTLREAKSGVSVSATGVTTPLVARLAVRQIGVNARHLGRRLTNASWGVALANPSRSKDALEVSVYV